MSRIVVESADIAGVPLLVVAPAGGTNLPTVIYVHGFFQDKVSGIELAYRLADAGIAAISIDASMQGERRSVALDEALDPEKNLFPPDSGLDVGMVYNRCVVETARDIDRLIAALAADSRFATDRIGICGFSLGGVVTYMVAAHNPSIKVAAPIGAVPSQLERWRDVIFETSTDPRWARAITANQDRLDEITALLRENDTIAGLLAFAPKPLLIVNGDVDTDQPKHYSLKLVRALQPLYADCPDRLRMFIPPVDHSLTGRIIKEVCAWFVDHL